MLQPGASFAGYRIVRRIGAGGMGVVYLAEHPRLPRQDVLKLLPADQLADPRFRVRFDREAELAARLRHPNIVTVHDRGVTGEQPWIAMEYVPGTDAAALAGSPDLGPRRAAHIIDDAARGLDHAHRNGMLHRDVKPANILVTADPDREFGERALLTDFGIARLAREGTELTRTGDVIATVSYAAPEQFTAGPVDHRADVYGLGCTLFVLLTGEKPFPVHSTAAVVHAHLNTPPPAASRRAPGLPSAIDAVLSRALAKNPADRYDSCRAFSADALRALESAGLSAQQDPLVTGNPTTPIGAQSRPDSSPSNGLAPADTQSRTDLPPPSGPPAHVHSAIPSTGAPASPPDGPQPHSAPAGASGPFAGPSDGRPPTDLPHAAGLREYSHPGGPGGPHQHTGRLPDSPPPALTQSPTTAGSALFAGPAAPPVQGRIRKRAIATGTAAALLAGALATTAVLATDSTGPEAPQAAGPTAPGGNTGTPAVSTPVSTTRTAPTGSGYTKRWPRVQGENGKVSWDIRIPQVSGGTAAVTDKFNSSVRAALQDQIDNAPESSALTNGPPDELHIGRRVVSALLTTTRNSTPLTGEPERLLATITINADTAEPITLRDLFPDLDAGLGRLSDEAARLLPATAAGPDFERRKIQPRTRNFHHWVATDKGMVIHFEEDSVAPAAKGLISITVAWHALDDVLDPALAEVLRG